MDSYVVERPPQLRRTPQGVRGLKLSYNIAFVCSKGSHPARGAWIEMDSERIDNNNSRRRTPQGVRGLK